MAVLQTEIFEAFRAIDIPEDKALKAAAALSKRDGGVASLKTDTAILKRMMGFVLAFQAASFAKPFFQ
ncbi:MAG: integrase [Beijerinckiaceae bacterium]|nr:integrase [Beijerinckiaceae bacterium]MCI0736714.1 integrase [Beijerinckiaceae bacterium]